MNNRGQDMILGIMILVMTVIVFIALVPAMSNMFDSARQCDNLNCEGYVDQDATAGNTCTSTNRSYQSSGNDNDLSCTVIDLGIPYLILAVLIALVTKLIHGKLVSRPEPDYGSYQGYQQY